VAKDPRNKPGMSFFAYQPWGNTTFWNAQLGNLVSARAALSRRTGRYRIRQGPFHRLPRLDEIGNLTESLLECTIDQAEGNYAKVHAKAVATADNSPG